MAVVMNIAPSRRQRKKEAVRSQIIASSIELFSVHGIEGVTVDQIAETADIGKGTIYNYFQTKEDIVVAFIVDFERQVQAELHRFTSSRRRLDAILTDFIRLQFRLKERHHRFTRVFLAQMFLRTEAFLPYMIEIQKVVDPPLESLFRNLQDRGIMRSDLRLEDLILSFKTMVMGLTALWAVEGPPFHATEHLLGEQMKMFCEGIRRTA
jgi:TetR/AcrR family transcriptional regulator of autoinduction and epiphytic fitness